MGPSHLSGQGAASEPLHQEQVHHRIVEEEKEGLACHKTLGEALDERGPELRIPASGAIATTKSPLAVILMELTHQLRMRRRVLRAVGLLRLQNQRADDWSNGDLQANDPSKRTRVDLEYLLCAVLPGLRADGSAYVEALATQGEAERSRKAAVTSGKARVEGPKRRKEEQLRLIVPRL